MVRNYVRKSNRRSWTLEKLQSAINAVRTGISKCRASREYGIPKRTLLRYLSKASLPTAVSRFGSFLPIFTEEQEEELMEYLVFMSECYFGLTPRDIRSLAFELAELNEIPHPFNASSRMAGYNWMKCFLKRHPGLKLRSSENTSLGRARGFNRDSIRMFFDLLEEIFNKHTYPAHRIWNMDETGFSTVSSTSTPKYKVAHESFFFAGSNEATTNYCEKRTASCSRNIVQGTWNKYYCGYGYISLWTVFAANVYFC